MAYQLIIFPTPLDAHCELTHDDLGGVARIVGVPVVHPTGRRGQAFNLPEPLPNGHGARIVITADGYNTEDQRGTVYLNDGVLAFPWTPGQTAAWVGDDFVLSQKSGAAKLPRLVRNGLFLAQEMP